MTVILPQWPSKWAYDSWFVARSMRSTRLGQIVHKASDEAVGY
jgi:hypothetical protein